MTTSNRRPPATGAGPAQDQVGVLPLAPPGVEGRCEKHILDLLRGDPVPRDVGDVGLAPQHVVNTHLMTVPQRGTPLQGSAGLGC